MAKVHGSADQAVAFLTTRPAGTPCTEMDFLHAWSAGDLKDWPEYYAWLDQNDAGNLQPYRFDPASIALGFAVTLLVFIIPLYVLNWPHT